MPAPAESHTYTHTNRGNRVIGRIRRIICAIIRRIWIGRSISRTGRWWRRRSNRDRRRLSHIT
jgi:hypothetical protein